jgi:hypothetical protein
MSTEELEAMDFELTRASEDLARSRDQFVVSMGVLEQEVTRTLDWRQWVRRRPGMALCLAFGLGLFVGRRRLSP